MSSTKNTETLYLQYFVVRRTFHFPVIVFEPIFAKFGHDVQIYMRD